MKDFLKKIVSAIVERSEEVEIKETVENGLTIYTIGVPQNEVGRIIGKEGRVINAIRSLARLKALKTQERVLIKIEGQGENGFSLPTKTDSPDTISG